MTRDRHSYVPFYMNDWAASSSGMSREQWSVLFQVCCYNWDKCEPVPAGRLALLISDLGEAGDKIVHMLVDAGSLQRDERGVFSARALAEAEKAFGLWEAKSRGGKGGKRTKKTQGDDERVLEESSKTLRAEQEQEQDSIPVGPAQPAPEELLKQLFDMGVGLLTKAGKPEKAARSLIGKWRKAVNNDGKIIATFIACQARGISDPEAWLTAALKPTKYVSASGHEYKGTLEQIADEAKRRHDMDTYWGVQRDIRLRKESGTG